MQILDARALNLSTIHHVVRASNPRPQHSDLLIPHNAAQAPLDIGVCYPPRLKKPIAPPSPQRPHSHSHPPLPEKESPPTDRPICATPGFSTIIISHLMHSTNNRITYLIHCSAHRGAQPLLRLPLLHLLEQGDLGLKLFN